MLQIRRLNLFKVTWSMVNFPNVTWTRGSVPKSRSNQKPGGLLVLCSQNHCHLLIQGSHFPQGSLQEAVNQDDLCAHMLRFLCLLSLTPSASNTDTHNIHMHTHAHIHKCTCAHVYIHVPLVKQVTWAIGCEKDNPPIDDKNHFISASCDVETVEVTLQCLPCCLQEAPSLVISHPALNPPALPWWLWICHLFQLSLWAVISWTLMDLTVVSEHGLSTKAGKKLLVSQTGKQPHSP